MKAIYLTDLAQQYFPKSSTRSAVAQLRRWIVLNEDLQQRLTELHFHKGQRSLTPLQHEAICHFLGEPGHYWFDSIHTVFFYFRQALCIQFSK